MHEHGEADKLMRSALRLAEEQGKAKISKIDIGIGVLTGLYPNILEEQLQHVAKHFELPDIQFVFMTVLPEATCSQCGKNIGQEYVCPYCGSKSIQLEKGMEAFVMGVS